jgi:hypothetical protein
VIRLSICLAFYRNQGMLAHQFGVWANYPDDLKSQVEALIVDDSSPESAMDVPRPATLPRVVIGRMSDVADPLTPPWRQDAARNRAAHDASGDWLFLSDMDHVLPAASLRDVFGLIANGKDAIYSFSRLDAPDLVPKRDKHGNLHPHPNTYLMKKARYWAIGGYDEDILGIYGTDGYYRRNLVRTNEVIQTAIPIVRFPREVIPDASTRIDRDKFRDTGRVQKVLADKQRKGLGPSVLKVPYRQQFPEDAA